MSELAFDILRAAVRVARDEQIRRLDTLKMRLAAMFPNNPEEIKEALATWALRVKEYRSHENY